MGFFVGTLFVIFAIVAGVVGAACISNDATVSGTIAWVVFVALVIGFFIVPFSFHTVDTGEVAVVKTFGEAKETKGPGLNYDFWMVNSYEYINTKTQELPISTMAYSSDAQTMTIEMTVQYQILGDKALDIVKNYGTAEALTSRITAIATEAPKSVLSTRAAMDIIANRGQITPEVEVAIVAAIGDQYYVTINKVTITNIDFSDAFEQAVEEKMIAEQAKLKAEYENEKKIATAKADAEAKLAAAEAEAKAKLLEAEAEAKANKLLEESLTDKILRDKYLNKWDGKLPSTMLGDDTNILIPAN